METMTEQECREKWQAEAKKQTLETLPAFLAKLTAHPHDYGTICVAIGAAAVGAAWAIEHSPCGGITGFQASVVQWEFIGGWGEVKNPQRLVDYGNLLYPQYYDDFNSISPDTAKWLKDEAKKNLKIKSGPVDSSVRAHWERVAAGEVPFGLKVSDV